jgi:hypothetical protein
MLTMSIIALISTAGIAFYARFFVALWRGRKSPRRTYGYYVRLDCDEAKSDRSRKRTHSNAHTD